MKTKSKNLRADEVIKFKHEIIKKLIKNIVLQY